MTEPTKAEEGDSLWNRLRRRKVVQWGIAYAAGAWLLMQVLEYFTETFHWPEQLRQLATLALLIGLPIVLVVAWYHGDRGEQRARGIELGILTLLFVLGGVIFWLYDPSTKTPTTAGATRPASTSTPSSDPRPSIAVLPFENRSRLEDDVYFVDGIHDDILTQLSKVSALKVISRTSVEQFRDTKLPIREIASQLSVKSILEGGVQRAGDRVRINVQLIDAGTDAHVWAETYDRELIAANIFAIQGELAASIAGALKATLTPEEQARSKVVPTQKLEAWEAYQLGKQRMAGRTSAGLADAEGFFRKAVDLDPKFALAYVGLADALYLQITYSGAPSESTLRYAEKAVAEALTLDPNLAEAWATSAAIALNKGEFDRAETMFRRAIKLNPNYATSRNWYSGMLTQVGRLDEALTQAQRAAELDPLSVVIRQTLAEALEAQGRFQEAGEVYRRAITIEPSTPGGYLGLAFLDAYALNSFADAVPLALKAKELDSGGTNAFVTLAMLYLDLGDDTHATRLFDAARQRWSDDDLSVLFISTYLSLLRGDQKAALHSAERILEINPQDWNALLVLANRDLHAGQPQLARARYATGYPELVGTDSPAIDGSNWFIAIELALVLQKTGEEKSARALLDRSERFIRSWPRLGVYGFGIADVQIHALRGDKGKALAALRQAEKAGWRGELWRFYRDVDPNLASIRNEPEFKAIFADIERDMARQRAALAARPKDAPLELKTTGT